MTSETIFSSYRRIEQYHHLIEQAQGARLYPPVALSPIDAFLMRLLVAYYPVRPQLIDLAADLTFGASAILWADTHPSIHQVFVTQTNRENHTQFDWRAFFPDALEIMGLSSVSLKLVPPIP